MPPAGFEPTIPVTKRKSYALDRSATGIGEIIDLRNIIFLLKPIWLKNERQI
jgi:hypothetical protein